MAPPTTGIGLFPLSTVLCPGGVLTLQVFETRYLDMIMACIKTGSPFGVCRIIEGPEAGAFDANPVRFDDVGCLARIAHWDIPRMGLVNLRAIGMQRFRAVRSWTQPDRLHRADIELIANDADTPVPDDATLCRDLLGQVIDAVRQLPHEFEDVFATPLRLDDAGWVANRLVERIEMDMEVRQQLMEEVDPVRRLRAIRDLLTTIDASDPPQGTA